jgi:hypothetical protein
MNTNQLAQQIDEVERALEQQDPALAKRFEKLQRADTRNDVAVFSLLAVSVVLLGVFWATLSVAAGIGGVAAFLASFLVDTRHQRRLKAPNWPRDGSRHARRGEISSRSNRGRALARTR